MMRKITDSPKQLVSPLSTTKVDDEKLGETAVLVSENNYHD